MSKQIMTTNNVTNGQINEEAQQTILNGKHLNESDAANYKKVPP